MIAPTNAARPPAAGSTEELTMSIRDRHALVCAVGLLLACSGLVGCSNLLDVRLPGNVPDEALNDPALAPVLVQSVIADFECAWASYVAGTALLSDQFIQ